MLRKIVRLYGCCIMGSKFLATKLELETCALIWACKSKRKQPKSTHPTPKQDTGHKVASKADKEELVKDTSEDVHDFEQEFDDEETGTIE